ncbi:MAG: sulfatase-like hydrolase/transferase [Thermoguttaceae bacterium]|jgi:arylsulfatase A-like enzyme
MSSDSPNAMNTVAARQLRRSKNIFCLTIDRLNCDILGAYGATSVETPSIDALAAESILFDSFYASSLDRDALYRAFLRGEAPNEISLDDKLEDRESIFRVMKKRGYRTFLISDVESVAHAPYVDSDDCDGRILLDSERVDAPVESVEETACFKNFEKLARFLVELDDHEVLETPAPWFVWCFLSGWNEEWDWPLALRESFRHIEEEEELSDPESYGAARPPYFRRPTSAKRVVRRERVYDAPDAESLVVSASSAPLVQEEHRRLAALSEPERRQAVVQAYCGGVATFDDVFGAFFNLVKERDVPKHALFALTGARGFALGDPSALGIPGAGDATSPFYSEELRVPLIVRLPDGTGATLRLPTLCEPRDLFATLRDWHDFAETLAEPGFWRLESQQVSPFAGKWSDDPPEEIDESAPTSAFDTSKEGQNLLALLCDESSAVRDSVLAVAKDSRSPERALVVDDWFLKRTPLDPDEIEDEFAPVERFELFVFPDDRYCVNDVADRCQDDVDALRPYLRMASESDSHT